MRLAFVCTGNICRSPMAEYLLKDLRDEKAKGPLEVTSAGVSATPGRPASQPAVEALGEIGVDGIAMHQAQHVSSLDLGKGDLLLTMTPAHLSLLPPELAEGDVRTGLLKEYVGRSGGISDPYGAGIETYRQLREELKPIISDLLEDLQRSNFEPRPAS